MNVVKYDLGISPQVTKVKKEGNARFECVSNGTVIWYYEGYDEITKYFVSVGSYLMFNTVQLSHGGYYFCYGLLPDGKTHFLARAELRVFGELSSY